MKKPLLIGLSLLSVGLISGIYAQTTGATGSLVDKMNALAHSFTLSATLNPGETGLQSAPVKGKKTGDILTAGEWNRVLELVGQGGDGGNGAVFRVRLANNYNSSESVPLVVHWDTEDFDVGNQFNMTNHSFTPTAAGYYYLTATACFDNLNSSNGNGADQVAVFISKNGVGTPSEIGANLFQGTNIVTTSDLSDPCVMVSGVVYSDGDDSFAVRVYQDDVTSTPVKAGSIFSGFQIGGGAGSGGGAGWVDVPLTDTNPFEIDNCEYRFRMSGVGGNSVIPGFSQTHWYDVTYKSADAIANAAWVYLRSGNKQTVYVIDTSNNGVMNVTAAWGWRPTKIEKLCGGGGSASAGGASNITWANFDGSGGVAMKGSNGITSIVRESVGNYRVTFATPRPNTDYGIICTSGPSPSYLCFPHEKSTTSFLIKTSNPSNNVDAPFVSLIVTPFDVLAGSVGSSSPVFYKCTNAQSLDTSNIPCYGASRNQGLGDGRYRVVSCHIRGSTGHESINSQLLNFGRTGYASYQNKWNSLYTDGEWQLCVEGSVLVVDTQASGAGVASSAWVDVPLTDTADYDTSCEYKMKVNNLASAPGFSATGDYWYFATGVGAKSIIYIAHASNVSHVDANSKSSFKINGVSAYTVLEIQKRCN